MELIPAVDLQPTDRFQCEHHAVVQAFTAVSVRRARLTPTATVLVLTSDDQLIHLRADTPVALLNDSASGYRGFGARTQHNGIETRLVVRDPHGRPAWIPPMDNPDINPSTQLISPRHDPDTYWLHSPFLDIELHASMEYRTALSALTPGATFWQEDRPRRLTTLTLVRHQPNGKSQAKTQTGHWVYLDPSMLVSIIADLTPTEQRAGFGTPALAAGVRYISLGQYSSWWASDVAVNGQWFHRWSHMREAAGDQGVLRLQRSY